MVIDNLLTNQEILILKNLAQSATQSQGGGAGGASIFELYSSVTSMGEKFISLFAMRNQASKAGDFETLQQIESIYSAENLETYTNARKKVQNAIGEMFGLDSNLLHLAQPTFFSRLTNKDAATPHDEYWHRHIDTNQYQTFDYTALIYLNNQRNVSILSLIIRLH